MPRIRVTESYRGTLPRTVEHELRQIIHESIAEVVAEMDDEELPEDVPVEEIVDEILEEAEMVNDELEEEEEEPVGEEVMPLDELDEEEDGQVGEQSPPTMTDEEEEEIVESILRRVGVLDRLSKMEQQQDLERSGRILEGALRQSRLPAPLANVVRGQFSGRVFEYRELEEAIMGMREAATQLDATGRVQGAGGVRGGHVRVSVTGQDQAEVEFLRLLAGNSRFRALESVDNDDVQDRLWTPAYESWVRAGRPQQNVRRLSNLVYELLGGDPFADARAYEAVTTSGMTSIVKNTLNLLLAADYAKRHEWWGPIVQEEQVDTIDDATLVRVHGLDTLDVVNEGGPYTPMEWDDEEETASFHKRGNYVPVTMETLLNDKLNIVRSIPKRLATSWYNTLSTLVAGVFTVNSAAGPVLSDTGALFNSTALGSAGGHANLRTTALSFTEYDAVVTAMQKQTDQPLGAGQRLLIEPKYVLVPPDLRTTALQIRNSELIPGSADNDINPYQGSFEVLTVPNWTDANNWATVADPAMFPAIWLIFLKGRKVPELFTADGESSGTMFTNDTIRYKVRLLTWRFSSTYNCAPVSDWRGLHKNNVA